MVPINLSGAYRRPPRDSGTLASHRLSSVLALEVALAGRAVADRDGTPAFDPADEQGERALGRVTHSRELLNLGLQVAQTTVAKYMVKRRGSASPGCATL